MRAAPENPTLAIVNIARSACAAGVFEVRALRDRGSRDVVATHWWRPKPRCADSESRFLAIKKFSSSAASRLIAARQKRFFARIAAADSQGEILVWRGASSLW
jgi:hypothetical protein